MAATKIAALSDPATSLAVGLPPAPSLYAYRLWLQGAMRAILALCPLARATTYYIAYSAGGNSTGGGGAGTAGSPYLCASAQDLATLVASLTAAGNVRVRLAAGSVFRSAGAGAVVPMLTISGANVTIDGYGVGPRPVLSRFEAAVTSGWTLGGGTRYTRAVTSEVRAVIRAADRISLTPLAKAASSAECEATLNSWFWGSNVLHLNVGADPATVTGGIEWLLASSVPNTFNASDQLRAAATATNFRLHGIDLIGGGVGTTDGVRGYNVRLMAAGSTVQCITDCGAAEGDNHNIGHNTGSGASGGVVLVAGCRVGGCDYADFTSLVDYADGGLNEGIWHDIELVYAARPIVGGSAYRGLAFYGHTAGVGSIDYVVVSHLRTARGIVHKPFSLASIGNLATAASIAETCFVRIDCAGEMQAESIFLGAMVGCDLRIVQTATQMVTTTVSGWVVASRIVIDLRTAAAGVAAIYNAPPGSTATSNRPRIWHSAILVKGLSTQGYAVGWDEWWLADWSSLAECHHSVIAGIGFTGDNFKVGLYNHASAASNYQANAVFGPSATSKASVAGYSNWQATVELPAYPLALETGEAYPLASDPLAPGIANSPVALLVDCDMRGRRIDPATRAIGPFAGAPQASGVDLASVLGDRAAAANLLSLLDGSGGTFTGVWNGAVLGPVSDCSLATEQAASLAALVETYIINEGDSRAVIAAIADKIAADWVAGDASPQAIVAAMKADAAIATLLSRVDAAVTSRLAAAGYTPPLDATATQAAAAAAITAADVATGAEVAAVGAAVAAIESAVSVPFVPHPRQVWKMRRLPTHVGSAYPITKQPGEALRVYADFGAVLGAGESIGAVETIAVTEQGSAGVTIVSGSVQRSGALVSAVVSGGAAGVDTKLQFAVQTTTGAPLIADGALRLRD